MNLIISDLIKMDYLDSANKMLKVEIFVLESKISLLDQALENDSMHKRMLNKSIENMEKELKNYRKMENSLERKLKVANLRGKILGGANILLFVVIIILIV